MTTVTIRIDQTCYPKDSFIFKIGSLHREDLLRIESMYEKYLSNMD